jgi:hypothetical protein
MTRPDPTTDALSVLFSTFPPMAGAETPEGARAAMRAYRLALGGYDRVDIVEGIRRLVAGDIPEHDARFAPTAPQLARAVKAAATERAQQASEQEAAALQFADRSRDEDRKAGRTGESRARVRALVDAFVRGKR